MGAWACAGAVKQTAPAREKAWETDGLSPGLRRVITGSSGLGDLCARDHGKFDRANRAESAGAHQWGQPRDWRHRGMGKRAGVREGPAAPINPCLTTEFALDGSSATLWWHASSGGQPRCLRRADALVYFPCLFQVHGAQSVLTTLDVASANTFPGSCFLWQRSDTDSDYQGLLVVAAERYSTGRERVDCP